MPNDSENEQIENVPLNLNMPSTKVTSQPSDGSSKVTSQPSDGSTKVTS